LVTCAPVSSTNEYCFGINESGVVWPLMLIQHSHIRSMLQ